MEYIINDELLIRYLTETLTADEIMQIEQWYGISEENRKILEQLYFTLQTSNCLKVMQSVNSEKALSDLKERIRKKGKTIKQKLLLRRIQQIAAVLFLPVVILSAWALLQKNEIQVQYFDLYSNPGMVASFELPDGSKVWLNGGSHLRYPNVFKGKNREVEMSGQGYFEIVKNVKQPFSVKTSESFSLEVLGTSFNLSAYDDEHIIETTLVEGSVKLKVLQDGKLVQHVMKPNEKVIYTKNKEPETIKTTTVSKQNPLVIPGRVTKSEIVKIAAVDPKYDIAWKDQQILFKNHSMEEVIRMLGRYYNVQFVVKDEKVMDSEITGKFSNEQLPQVMEYLKIASGIKYNIVPATVGNDEMNPSVIEIWK